MNAIKRAIAAFSGAALLLACACGEGGMTNEYGDTDMTKGVWAKDIGEQMNVTLAFSLDLGAAKDFTCELAAASLYRFYLDGEFVSFGPQRAAKNFARSETFSLRGRFLTVEVESIYVETFWVIKQRPFFYCEVTASDGAVYSAEDFSCVRYSDRLQKVQRYSYQRGFIEDYVMSEDRTALYAGKKTGACPVATEPVAVPELLPSLVDKAKFSVHAPVREVERGRVGTDPSLPVWRDRAHTMIGGELEGFTIGEWAESATDEASLFTYFPAGKTPKNDLYAYVTYDFGRAITGFTEMKVKVRAPGVVYVVYDELLWHERGRGDNYVAFDRNTTSNVFKWRFTEPGEYSVSTFEPYTVRYACVVFSDGVDATVSLRDYENPNKDKLIFDCSDEQINAIASAARNTFAQNAADLLTDCPSRERAGWLSDSYFSSVAERIFTGDNQAERAFLDNYARFSMDGLPEGMVPMCYPSDYLGKTYIPNWSLWYIMEIDKYARIYGKDGFVEGARDNVVGILEFFSKYENEFGLLEDLESWVFVEWSSANDADHVRGVNVPSNIEYAACLKKAAALYGIDRYAEKADRVNSALKSMAFDGSFFTDNLVRDKSGNLVRSGLITEVCQYYAFWFGFADKEHYPDLYRELIDNLGTNRKPGYKPEIGEPNVFYGLYMRLDLLMRDGDRRAVLDECRRLFGPMAERTGTLWEHNGIYASCDHGFASYAIKWLVFALTGYDAESGATTDGEDLGISYEIVVPGAAGVALKNK